MEATARQYYKIKEVAEILGLDYKTVLDNAHATGQDFAFQPIKNGVILIDLDSYRRWRETVQNYCTAKEAAKMMGLTYKTVLNYVREYGQEFAAQSVKNGKFLIDFKAFQRWLEKFGRVRNRPGTR